MPWQLHLLLQKAGSQQQSTMLQKAARSVAGVSGFSAARQDRVLATNLLKQMQDRRGCFKYAAGYYDAWHNALFVPILVISFIACLTSMFWGKDKHINMLMIIISTMGSINIVLTAMSSLLKYQSKAIQFDLASNQYEAIASQLSFATQHLIGMDRARLVKLTKDAVQQDIDVRTRAPQLPAMLETRYQTTSKPSSFDGGLSADVLGDDDHEDEAETSVEEIGSPAKSANPEMDLAPSDKDFKRLDVLRDTLVARRGAFEYAGLHYEKRLYMFLIASLCLSALTTCLASGWDGSVRAYQGVIVLTNVFNMIILGVMSGGKFQFKVDSAKNAAAQYDVLVSKATFARHFSLSVKRSTVIELALETEKADTDIRKNAFTLPHKVEAAGVAYAKEVERAKKELIDSKNK
jgi:hypothetical protein